MTIKQLFISVAFLWVIYSQNILAEFYRPEGFESLSNEQQEICLNGAQSIYQTMLSRSELIIQSVKEGKRNREYMTEKELILSDKANANSYIRKKTNEFLDGCVALFQKK